MKRWWNVTFQFVASATQLANMYSGFIPAKYQGTVLGALSIAQATVGVIAHNFNPDGTPAALPYTLPKR